jgi:hypothetical protein
MDPGPNWDEMVCESMIHTVGSVDEHKGYMICDKPDGSGRISAKIVDMEFINSRPLGWRATEQFRSDTHIFYARLYSKPGETPFPSHWYCVELNNQSVDSQVAHVLESHLMDMLDEQIIQETGDVNAVPLETNHIKASQKVNAILKTPSQIAQMKDLRKHGTAKGYHWYSKGLTHDQWYVVKESEYVDDSGLSPIAFKPITS